MKKTNRHDRSRALHTLAVKVFGDFPYAISTTLPAGLSIVSRMMRGRARGSLCSCRC